MALEDTEKEEVTVFGDTATTELFVVHWAAAHPCLSGYLWANPVDHKAKWKQKM